MATRFRHLRAQYYDADPVHAAGLRDYHVREKELAGLIFTETRHPPDFRIPKHAHDLPSFYLVLEGNLSEVSDRAESRLDTSAVMFTPAGDIHRNTFYGAGGQCFLVELGPAWAARLADSEVRLERPIAAHTGALTHLARRLHSELRCIDSVSPLSIEGLALEIVAGLARQRQYARAGHPPGWLRTARELLHDRFAESLTLSEVAGQVGVTPVQLARGFRRYYGCTLGDCQRGLRIEHASRLLTSTAQRLSEIAHATGFADQSHFSRVFKDRTGLTPAQFRAIFMNR